MTSLPAIPSRPMTADEAASAFQACAVLAVSRDQPRRCVLCGAADVLLELVREEDSPDVFYCEACSGDDWNTPGAEIYEPERLFTPAPAGIPGQLQL